MRCLHYYLQAVFGAGVNGTASISLPDSNSLWYGLEVCNLNDVDEVEIAGAGITASKIRYRSNLRIGYYSCMGAEKTFNGTGSGSGYNSKYVANVGNFIYALNSKNVWVHDMEIDGFNTPPPTSTPSYFHTNYGGSIGVDRIQLGASGLLFINSKKITVKNINAHNMTFDGIQVKDHYYQHTLTPPVPDSLLTNLDIDSSNFNYNRRLGFAWVGGRGIKVSNSTFNNTGVPVYNWNGGIANGNPGAGIDIEPESFDLNGTKTLLYCMDANFSKCQFVNNMGAALVNDFVFDTANPTALPRAINMNFTKNLFHDVNGYAVWVKGRKFTFDSCQLWGGFVFGNSLGNSGDETKFINCDFADEDIAGVSTNIKRTNELINLDNYARKPYFSGCTFRALHDTMRILYIQAPTANETEFPVFNNCTFSYKNTHVPTTSSYDFIRRCVFSGNNVFRNNNPNQRHEIAARALIFTGSANILPCTPHSFTLGGLQRLSFDANNETYQAYVLGRDTIGGTNNNGHFNFTIGDSSLLYNFTNSKMRIGGNSVLRNRPNGSLVIRGRNSSPMDTIFFNNGKIILEQNSTTLFPDSPYTAIRSGANAEFYLHKLAVTKFPNAFWPATQPSMNITGRYLQGINLYNTKFDGGNTEITNQALITSTNEALRFDGVDDYVQVPFPAPPGNFNWFTTNSWSIEIAFRITNTGTGGGSLFGYSTGSDISIGCNQSGFVIDVPSRQSPGLSAEIEIPYNLSNNSCYFLTVTRNASDNRLRVYLDGNLIYITPGTFFVGYYLSQYNTARMGIFDGWISQVRLWNTTLSQAEICHNYKRKKPLSSTGLWADWDMIDNGGTTVTNSINPGSTTNGTFINGTGNNWVNQFTVGNCTNASGFNNSFNNFRPAPSTGIQQIYQDKENFTVSPNPTNGIFELRINNAAEKQTAFIYNAAGKLICNKNFGNKTSQVIDISNVSNGIYILKLCNGKEIIIRKIVVHK